MGRQQGRINRIDPVIGNLLMRLLSSLRITLEMIKFEHTLFALPFALLSAILASGGLPKASKLFWILLAMVGARSAAMAFNRIADRRIDAENPRTRLRALPAGQVSLNFAGWFTAGSESVICDCSSPAQSSVPVALLPGTSHIASLFLHQAFYQLLASLSWPVPGVSPSGHVDRSSR